MGGSDIEGFGELHKASAWSGEEAGVRQLAELTGQLAIFGAGALQGKRVLVRHAPVSGRELLNRGKILGFRAR
jgi:hypothetical protein